MTSSDQQNLFLFLTLAGVVMYQHAVPHIQPTDIRYGIVIDAGSSGSRVRVFAWMGQNLQTMDSIPLVGTCDDVSPGISTYSNPVEAAEALRPLFRCAKATVPKAYHHATPIYLRATAGVRLLPAAAQTRLMEGIGKAACSEVPFVCRPNHFVVISGADEGIFLWLSINHLLHNFAPNSPHPTVGVLDMGGASSQIASATTDMATGTDVYVKSIPGYLPHQHLYAKSILGGGMGIQHTMLYLEILERMAKAQTEAASSDHLTLADPCANTGFHNEVDLSPAIALRNISSAARSLLGSSTKVSVLGDSSPAKCLELCSLLVQRLASCSSRASSSQNTGLTSTLAYHEPTPQERWDGCSIANQPLPPLTSSLFYSVSNYFYVAKFFRLGETVSVREFALHANDLCALPWASLVPLKKSKSDPVEEFCFRALYLSVFLDKGLGFDSTDQVSLHFVGQLSNNPTDWTLGVMLDAVGSMPAPTQGTTFRFIDLIVVLVLLIGVASNGFGLRPLSKCGGKAKSSPRQASVEMNHLLDPA